MINALVNAPSQQPAAYALNARPCSAAAYTAAACDPDQHIAIEACAGSGKTWILVSRIVRALLAGAAPASILAITFTKKAAGEMQQRLSDWLGEFASMGDEALRTELQARGITQPSAADVAKLRGLQAQLLQQPQGVQIRTFHGWFASLLKAAPLSVFSSLSLPTPFEWVESDEEIIAQTWPLFYQALERDASLLEDHRQLVMDIGAKNAGNALTAALRKRLEFDLADHAGTLAASFPPLAQAFPDLARYGDIGAALGKGSLLRTQLLEHCASLSSATDSAQKQAALLQDGLTQGDWQTCCEAVFTGSGKQKGKGEPRKVLEKEAAGQAIIAILQELRDWQLYAQLLPYQERMRRLARTLIDSYQTLKRQRAWLDMVDVEHAAQTLLTDPQLAAWMQERLDAQVRHLLIDEFQDTSPLQWQILKPWLESYAGVGGGSAMPRLFLVGDPKQSIYRFRNAEPRVFKAAQELVAQLGGQLLSCDHTRRNPQALIQLLNRSLGASAMADFRAHTSENQALGCIYRYDGERSAKPPTPDDTVWRDSLSTPKKAETSPAQLAEYQGIAAWLAAQIAQGQQPQDFMILARKHEALGGVFEQLAALGIPAVQKEQDYLPQHMEVQDIMALLDVLLSPHKNLSLAQVLKSPITAFSGAAWTDDDLCILAAHTRAQQGSPQQNTWWQSLHDLAASQHTQWQPLCAQLLQWQQWAQSLPPYDALAAIYDAGQIMASYSRAAPAARRARVLANLQGLLQTALDFDHGRFTNCWQLLRALKNPRLEAHFKSPAMAQENAVQLLTIHGAKGLEAEHVVLLGTRAGKSKQDYYGVLCDWPAERSAPQRFVFMRPADAQPAQLKALLEQEKTKQANDELNALYVALTRARQTLVLSATEAGKTAPANTWWDLLQAETAAPLPLPATPPIPAHAADGGTIVCLPTLTTAQAQPKLAPSLQANTPAIDEDMKRTARRGQALHRILEWGLPAAPDNSAWQERLMRDFTLDAATCEELLAQAQVLRSGGGAWVWDTAKISWAGNEVDIAHQGQLLRLDRLVQEASSGCWWVVDYKSAYAPEHKPELQAQMQTYIAAVQAAQPEAAAVRGAWIAGDGRWVEWVR